MRILLIGNPNVGKSVIFSQLTGVSVTTSNYPGTTVEFSKGYMTYNGEKHEIIDVPGTYDLDPTCQAEKVAVDMLDSGDVFINVVDSTNLERNLNLTLQLMEFGKPMVIALNLWDEARHKGIEIDQEKLSHILGVPVVPTSAVSGEGMQELREKCLNAQPVKWDKLKQEKRWEMMGNIVSQVQNLSHRHHTFLERLEDISIHPIFGLPVAFGILYLVFKFITIFGDLLEGLMLKFFQSVYSPFIFWFSRQLGGKGFLHYIFIGDISGGIIQYEEAMGVLTTGVYVAFGIVLPYIFLFYLIIGFLEDLGYLPRMAILFDKIMHKIGLHGYSILPMLLSFGCNVPGVLAVRNLETRRERFITAVVTCITIPCMAQTTLIFRMMGKRGGIYILLVFVTLVTVWSLLGMSLNRLVKGATPTLLIEVPPYRLPDFNVQMKKLWMRLTGFFKEAIPYVLGGVFIVNLMYFSGIIDLLSKWAAPLVRGIFGLPEETVSALIIGLLRKDVAVALLEPIGLTNTQSVVAVVVLILYFPCIATFTVLLKELGGKDMLKAIGIMFLVTLIAGGFLNLMLGTIFSPVGLIVAEIILIILFGTILGERGDMEIS
ncbi:MAG: ferrous iron transporter B [Clostridia bacterium]|nr:ferrous iron transporter B [Clostridia bacterium]